MPSDDKIKCDSVDLLFGIAPSHIRMYCKEEPVNIRYPISDIRNGYLLFDNYKQKVELSIIKQVPIMHNQTNSNWLVDYEQTHINPS